MRRFVIGDVHGCAKALRTIIEKIDPERDDQLIFLGDYIDRGPDSRDVIDQVIDLQTRCRVVPLFGNHELALLAILNKDANSSIWLANGGSATVASYGGSLAKIPDKHVQFLRDLQSYYECDDTICVHAGYNPALPMDQQDGTIMHWSHLLGKFPAQHCSGKRVFIGHTPQRFGKVLDGGHALCIDTYCFGGGYLTAFNLDTDEILQADRHGHLRRDPLANFFRWLRTVRGKPRSRLTKRTTESQLAAGEDRIDHVEMRIVN